jgi:OmpA-OmpF porin, OOP family
MKNPIPLLSVALAFVIFGSTFIRNMTCPCNAAEAVLSNASPPTTALAAIPIIETAKSVQSKEVLLNFNYNGKSVVSTKQIKEIQQYLKTHPYSTIAISGHADSRGSEEYNQKLSEIRAQRVMTLLVKKGLDATKITTEGKGETAPVASNETAEGRKQNRRVVVQIFE